MNKHRRAHSNHQIQKWMKMRLIYFYMLLCIWDFKIFNGLDFSDGVQESQAVIDPLHNDH